MNPESIEMKDAAKKAAPLAAVKARRAQHAAPVAATKRPSPAKARPARKAATKRASAKAGSAARAAAPARGGTKTDKILALLKRPDGATLKELIKATGC